MSKVKFHFEDIKPLKINKKLLDECIDNLVAGEEKQKGDITVVFCSDEYLLQMNRQYLDHDYFTDIITFDYVENNVISGDLFISVDRVKENAAGYNTEFKKELYRVVFHGVLHLVGYKDKSDDEQQIMRKKEDFYLEKVDFSKESL